MGKRLFLSDDELAYDHTPGSDSCVIFCAGFNSNKEGNKARFLEQKCLARGLEYIRFDYRGHGVSGGDFADCTVSTWIDDILAIIDKVAHNRNVILVGSSMGGWIALHAALKRSNRVKGLLLIACAADMTQYYPQRLAGLSLEKDSHGRGYYRVPNGYDDEADYLIYQSLIDDGEQHALLHKTISIDVPVRLIHGDADDVVEWERSAQVLKKLCSEDVRLELIKHGDHRLSNHSDLNRLVSNLEELIG